MGILISYGSNIIIVFALAFAAKPLSVQSSKHLISSYRSFPFKLILTGSRPQQCLLRELANRRD